MLKDTGRRTYVCCKELCDGVTGITCMCCRYVTGWMVAAMPSSEFHWTQPRNSWWRKSPGKWNSFLGSITRMLSGIIVQLN